jgi:hypothetical protein
MNFSHIVLYIYMKKASSVNYGTIFFPQQWNYLLYKIMVLVCVLMQFKNMQLNDFNMN